MTTDQINISLAKWEGWRDVHNNYNHAEFFPGGILAGKFGNKEYVQAIPSYTTDLNAVWKLEENLPEEKWLLYVDMLLSLIHEVDQGYFNRVRWEHAAELIHATASQRCEALLRTLGLWTDNP